VSAAARGRIYALRLVRSADRASFLLDQRDKQPSSMSDEAALSPLLDRARAASVDVRPLSFVTVDPGRDICDVASVKRADVVLLGWHKPVLGTTMLGGTVHEVMDRADPTVAVLVDRGLVDIARVLVPHLGRPHDDAALELARRIAVNVSASLTVLRVDTSLVPSSVDGSNGAPAVTPTSGSRTSAFVEETKMLRHESPIEAVIEESARGYDLVVVGIGTQLGLEHRSFGLRTEKVLSSSPTSVLVVRGSKTAPALALSEGARYEGPLAVTGE